MYLKVVETMWQNDIINKYDIETIRNVLNAPVQINFYHNFFSVAEKTKEQVIQEHWKFLYQGYKNILENCKYNFKLEQLYLEKAKQIYLICQKFGQYKCFKEIASLISYALKNTIKWMKSESNTLNMKIQDPHTNDEFLDTCYL